MFGVPYLWTKHDKTNLYPPGSTFLRVEKPPFVDHVPSETMGFPHVSVCLPQSVGGDSNVVPS
jgi:hypothetical protein